MLTQCHQYCIARFTRGDVRYDLVYIEFSLYCKAISCVGPSTEALSVLTASFDCSTLAVDGAVRRRFGREGIPTCDMCRREPVHPIDRNV